MKRIIFTLLAIVIIAIACEENEQAKTVKKEIAEAVTQTDTSVVDDSEEKEPLRGESDTCKYNIIGTWKCIAFGNSETGEERPIEPVDCEKCYVLTFKEDGTLNGTTCSNEMYGHYKINKEVKSLHCKVHACTEVNEFYDGELYLNVLSQTTNYSFSDKNELLLYYNKNEYLIFKPM